MPKSLVLCLACVLIVGCAQTTSPPPPRLTPLWTTPGFPNPESVALGADGTFLYVSNVNGEGGGKDGNGSISRLSLDGKVLQHGWATGLDAPKGLALRDARLYVSDLTQLVEVDSSSGKILARHDAPGSGFLNDVAFAPDGAVLVSDSSRSRIYAWREGRMQVWLEDDLLDSVNGLFPEAGRLVASTMQGRLLAIDWNTRAISKLAKGLGDGDGIAALEDGSYLVSEWPGRLFHVRADGASDVVLDGRKEKKFINDFLRVGDHLYVPHWEPGSVSAYRIEH